MTEIVMTEPTWARRIRWLPSRVVNRVRARRRYGRPIKVERLLTADRRLDGAWEGKHLVFPGTLNFGGPQPDDPPETFYPGEGFAMNDCLISLR